MSAQTNNQNCSKVSSFENLLKIGAILFLLLLTAGLYPSASLAQSRGFTISPPSLKFSIKPGAKAERIIKVTNNSDSKLDFVITVEDFVVTDKNGTPELLPPGTLPNNRYAASTWSAAIPESFSVEPGKSQTTTLYLQVPKDANPGGRYFAVAIRPTNGGTLSSSGASVNTVIGTLVYLTVEGKVTESAKIVNFFAKSLFEYGPIPLVTEIRNFGDLHITPKAEVKIKDLFGKQVFSLALDNLNIFPGQSRIYKNSWETKWLFGRFTANLEGYYGLTDKLPLTASLSFWVIPYKLITVVLLAIVIAVVVFFYFKKRKEDKEEIVEEELH